MYINTLTNVYPYSISQLHRDNPQISFPKGKLSDELLASFGVFPVNGETPEVSPGYFVEENVPTFDGTVWIRQFTTRRCNQVETDAQAEQVRQKRNQKLTESDWTQVADAPVDKAAWATYRQALRDITSQSGFPWSVVWPIEP